MCILLYQFFFLKVKAMAMYKTNWKWPTVEDVCWYPEEDVKIIEAPKLLSNSTTIYSCLEIKKKRTESSSLNNM